MTLELILPDQFNVTVTPTDYQFSEQQFYAGNISRVALTSIAKTATMTIEIKPLKYSYFIGLKDFFSQVRQHVPFKVDRLKLIKKNTTLPYLLKYDRLFFFKEPIKIDEKKIGQNGTLESLTIILQESYVLTPIPPITILSNRSVTSVKLLAAVRNN